MRQISLDTETTGLFYYQGHRIIEIGCVEIIDRKITKNTFQAYINPERLIDNDAKKITGLTDLFLKDKPLFKNVVNIFLNFIKDADEIIIHNAPFDINFINNEFKIINHDIKNIKHNFKIFDTLELARKLHPGKKNNLDALCMRYNISLSERKIHGALLDAELLAKVYLAMTENEENYENKKSNIVNDLTLNENIEILKANKQELNSHITYIKNLQEQIRII
ncbi:DNA polymerase III subunit epsilon [Candidatus Azoamicus ciliaticola]|uniref:DNA polymerase III subunit epsilon n=1 Tax=Candidatus Azoamicus ciliaticola TaxID=2652803 RepID=A0A6J5JY27_9GAMM|nr:DNA polymerase III subunit epsilon [Candidatus Azoamicus ciliaticola]CAB3976432.1 DNA polymerase III subunit epsilon [Candidatus Azoamicus ciliaticola]